jgi:hypothetical protein
MEALLARLRLAYWNWHVRKAKQFQAGLEATIVAERRRAVMLIAYSEAMAHRAEVATIEANANKALTCSR